MATKTSKRSEFLSQYATSRPAEFSKAAIEDLRFFAEEGKKGNRISLAGIQKFFREEHGITAGRTRFRTVCRENNLTWWHSV